MSKKPSSHEERLRHLFRLSETGDEDAYRLLLAEISGVVRAYLIRRMPRADDVEDVVQEVLVSVHKSRHTYDGARAFLPWLYAIIKFRFTDYLRHHYSRSASNHVDIDAIAEIPMPDVTSEEVLPEGVSEALAKLPEKQRRLLDLLHVEGYTAKEAGRMLGMNESAVKVAAHRIYKKLRNVAS